LTRKLKRVRHLEPREVLEVQRVEHVLRVRVDLHKVLVDGRDLGDEVHASFALLLLELERDAADRAARDALHEVRHEARDFVAHALRRDDGDLVTNPLVRVEVDAEPRVVLLDDDARRLLDRLRADAHLCIWVVALLPMYIDLRGRRVTFMPRGGSVCLSLFLFPSPMLPGAPAAGAAPASGPPSARTTTSRAGGGQRLPPASRESSSRR
ncbi:unnamed protein product, partial [Pelagomonas calceolata]